MPAGLGGGGKVGLAFEETMGTYEEPTIFCPILDEALIYTEDKYYSPQIRQQTIVSDVKPSFYHVEGPVNMEVDPNIMPYWLYASRHNIVKSGTGPYTYIYTPSNAGSVDSDDADDTAPKTLSITVVRNDVVFAYVGCVVSQFEFSIEDGVLLCNMDVIGMGEATQSAPTPTWVAPNLFGADAHRVYVAASGTTPSFSTADTGFNGFTFRVNYNAEAQNRIRADRQASYISFGETEAEIESELDFIDKTEYDNFKAAATRAIKLESTNGGATFAAASSAIRLQGNRVAYDAYDVALEGMADLIMAGFTGKMIGIAGGSAFEIAVKSAADIGE